MKRKRTPPAVQPDLFAYVPDFDYWVYRRQDRVIRCQHCGGRNVNPPPLGHVGYAITDGRWQTRAIYFCQRCGMATWEDQ